MKKLYIVGNWKSNKTIPETKSWFQAISNVKSQMSNLNKKEIIVCPPFTFLPLLKSYLINLKSNIKLGAQNISPFDHGAYTGEVNGKQLKELCDYVIIGHSERRKHFGETEEIIGKKIEQAVQYELTPIICISDTRQINGKWNMENGKLIVAYEPVFAIGSGNPDTPENADSIALKIKNKLGDVPILYGGSVKDSNVHEFTSKPNIDGVLVGGASLDAVEFSAVINNA